MPQVHKLWITTIDRGRDIRHTNHYNMENIKVGKVLKVGTSLAVVIPAELARALHIERGDQVVYGAFTDNQFTVRRLTTEELQAMKPHAIEF